MWSSWEICHVSSSDITFCFLRSCLFWNRTWPWKSSQVFFIFLYDLVAVEGRNEWRQKQVILSWCLWRVARVRLKTSFADQPAISPFLEVHAVFFQVSLWTGRGEGKGEGKKGARRNAQGFWFPYARNWCHVQINLLGGKYNNSS